MYSSESKASIGSYGGAMTGAGEAGRQLELPAQMSRMNKTVEELEHTVNELAGRLEGKVVRPSEPMPAPGNQISPVGPSTSYAQEVYSYSSRLASATDRVQDLLRRLEA